MRSQIGQKAKTRVDIPRFVVIMIIIVFIGGIIKGGQYVLSHLTGKQVSEAAQKALSIEAAKAKSSSSINGLQSVRALSSYQIITRNNLLRPLGWQEPVEIPRVQEPVVQREQRRESPVSLSNLVLTGIVHLDDQNIALVEDTSGGEAYFLKEGDRLKDHFVESVTEENMVLVNGDSRIISDLGSKAYYDSNGRILTSELARTQVTRDVAKNTGEVNTSPDESNTASSLIEQMKARRRRELGAE